MAKLTKLELRFRFPEWSYHLPQSLRCSTHYPLEQFFESIAQSNGFIHAKGWIIRNGKQNIKQVISLGWCNQKSFMLARLHFLSRAECKLISSAIKQLAARETDREGHAVRYQQELK